MEIFLVSVGVLLIFIGIIGCFVPVLPGPPLAYLSLLLLQVGPESPFKMRFLVAMALIVAAVTLLDYLVPAFGARKWGGTRYGIIGAFAGVLIGIFVFPPFGFFIFPLVGAFAGEVLNGANRENAMKAAFGTLIGLLFGTLLKFSLTVIIAYYFFANL